MSASVHRSFSKMFGYPLTRDFQNMQAQARRCILGNDLQKLILVAESAHKEWNIITETKSQLPNHNNHLVPFGTHELGQVQRNIWRTVGRHLSAIHGEMQCHRINSARLPIFHSRIREYTACPEMSQMFEETHKVMTALLSFSGCVSVYFDPSTDHCTNKRLVQLVHESEALVSRMKPKTHIPIFIDNFHLISNNQDVQETLSNILSRRYMSVFVTWPQNYENVTQLVHCVTKC